MKVFGSIAALGTALAGLGALDQLPSWYHKDWSGTLILVGTVGAFIAKLPIDWRVTSPNDVPAAQAPPQVELVKQEFDVPNDKAQ